MSGKAKELSEDAKAKAGAVEESEIPAPGDDTVEAGEGAGGGVDEEAEIVLAGDEGSQPGNENLGIRRRVNKLNAKVAAAQDGKTAAEAALEVEKERNRLLQLAIDQRDDAPEIPDPNDFDDGAADPKYISALQAHITKGVREDLEKSQVAQPAPQRAPDLEAKQVDHYKRAYALKVRDYDDTEDKAVAILGQDVAKQVIASSEKSPQVLYYLGKNPERAEEISELIKTDPVKGILEIGRLEARLTVKPKAPSDPAPDPDTELEGSTSPAANDYERKLDKLRDKAAETGDLAPVLAFKKEHAARAKQG